MKDMHQNIAIEIQRLAPAVREAVFFIALTRDGWLPRSIHPSIHIHPPFVTCHFITVTSSK
jgi:hypothetical protein